MKDLSEDELQSLKSSKSDSKSSLDGQSVLTGLRTSFEERTGSGPGSLGSETGQERLKMLTHILTSILDSEAIYLECLRKLDLEIKNFFLNLFHLYLFIYLFICIFILDYHPQYQNTNSN